ncbi:MAG: hypothetical protein KF688_04945 [Pirellulales bacterium]|nr:hypothetical protein [Pirellulales bacterium]
MLTPCARISILAGLLCTASVCRADFQLVESLSIPPFNSLARGDGQWHAAGITGWWTVDDSFSAPYAMTVASGSFNVLELAYDGAHNRMVLLEFSTGEVRFHGMDGSFQSSFDTGLVSANGLARDPRDGSLWVSNFSGFVRHYSESGSLLSGFNAGMLLSGLTFDPRSDSLLVLRADGPGGIGGSLDDELWEYSATGANLGRLWSSGEIPGNGHGLEYLPDEGKLYVKSGVNPQQPTAPYNATRIYQDLGRIPEPPTAAGALVTMAAVGAWRMRRRIG